MLIFCRLELTPLEILWPIFELKGFIVTFETDWRLLSEGHSDPGTISVASEF